MTWFRVGGAGIPASLKNAMNAVFNKKFGTSGQNYPPKQWPDDVNLMGPLPEGTVSGAIAVIEDGADDVPTKSVKIAIPASLSGVSAVSAVNDGKNLVNNAGLFPASGSVSSYYFAVFQYSNGTFPLIHLKAGITYTLSLDVTSTIDPFNFSVGCGNGSYSSDILTVYNKNNGRISLTFTPTIAQLENGDILAVRCPRYQAQNTFDYSISNVQLEYGSTAHAYEPYIAPTTYTANLGRTVHGGEVDIVNGTGTDDGATITLDENGSYGISTGSPTNRISVNFYNNVGKTNGTFATNDLTVGENTAGGYKSEPWVIWGSISAPRMWISVPTTIDTVDKFKQYLSENPITVAYQLSTPTDFTFTGQEVPTRLGYNAFWSEEGDTEVTYRADINLALQSLSGSRGLMMASRPVTQLIGEESDPDQVNELVENDETEQEGEDNAR